MAAVAVPLSAPSSNHMRSSSPPPSPPPSSSSIQSSSTSSSTHLTYQHVPEQAVEISNNSFDEDDDSRTIKHDSPGISDVDPSGLPPPYTQESVMVDLNLGQANAVTTFSGKSSSKSDYGFSDASTINLPERRPVIKKKPREGHNSFHRSSIGFSLKNHQQQQRQNSSNESIYIFLSSLNDTFTQKCIKLPFFPNTLSLGRQVNSKTQPTPDNGYFNSRVLSRQHAEIWADKATGQVWIRDIKSANGTFINGNRLLPEDSESEPYELKANDILELGIDISAEDTKGVSHNKVAARVDKVGFGGGTFQPGTNGIHNGPISLSFADIDPSANLAGSHNGAGNTITASVIAGTGGGGAGKLSRHRIISRILAPHGVNTKGPISLDMILRKLDTEVQFAKSQAIELDRATQAFESMTQAQAESVAEAAKIAVAASAGTLSSVLSEPESNDLEHLVAPLADDVHQADINSAFVTAAEQKLLAVTVSLQAAEQQITEFDYKIAELEERLNHESSARQEVEAKLTLAQRELELEREQAIDEFKESNQDVGELEFDDSQSTAADTVVLMRSEERRRRRSQSDGIDEDDVLGQLDLARRDAIMWESRALKAEKAAENNARALKHLISELRAHSGIEIFDDGHDNVDQQDIDQANNEIHGSKSRSRSRSRSPAVERDDRPAPDSPQIFTRTATLTPEEFKMARHEDDRADDKPPFSRRIRSRRSEIFKSQAGKPSLTLSQSSSSSITITTNAADNLPIREGLVTHHVTLAHLFAPLISAMTIVTIGLGIMVVLNNRSVP
ncbi:hypothetical protein V1514DRAFT_350985 [Lipomyces japonicus]|uniref:uncharacterized protein n=1 Tax=Lipomyces japonicus TaxID=56871 RepID=UPI0034CF9540